MRLADYLLERSVTQRQLAEQIGVSQGLVSQWISGETQITAERAVEIERATGGAVSRADLRPDLWSDAPAAGAAA